MLYIKIQNIFSCSIYTFDGMKKPIRQLRQLRNSLAHEILREYVRNEIVLRI